jgi:hypothetical protein
LRKENTIEDKREMMVTTHCKILLLAHYKPFIAMFHEAGFGVRRGVCDGLVPLHLDQMPDSGLPLQSQVTGVAANAVVKEDLTAAFEEDVVLWQ